MPEPIENDLRHRASAVRSLARCLVVNGLAQASFGSQSIRRIRAQAKACGSLVRTTREGPIRIGLGCFLGGERPQQIGRGKLQSWCIGKLGLIARTQRLAMWQVPREQAVNAPSSKCHD